MKVNSQKIIADTLEVFSKSTAQKEKFSRITEYVSSQDYAELHTDFLTPTTIKINSDQFLKEIEIYDPYFEQWGTQHLNLPRYGLALVNLDGVLKKNDPINGSLYEWNVNFPEYPIIESDCLVPTPVMKLESLAPLNIFNGHWCRSNILKWGQYADFKPHIDTIVPSPWIRLWGTTNPENIDVRYDNGQGDLIKADNIEAGRIYVIDTNIVHTASGINGTVHQFFLSVMPSSINILKEIQCRP
jgi:hypothetical protein